MRFVPGGKARNPRMQPMSRHPHRLWTLLALALGALAACSTTPSPDPGARLPYCHKNNKGRPVVCTTADAPSLMEDAEAKRFEGDPAALTVFVVRRIWSDGRNRLDVTVDGGRGIETVPRSMIRMKLVPGRHVLSFEYAGRRFEKSIVGVAGEVRFIGISGSVWAWRSWFDWSTDSEADLRQLAAKTRLVADVALPWAGPASSP